MRIGRRLRLLCTVLAVPGICVPLAGEPTKQTEPVVSRWMQSVLSSAEWESHAAIDPRTGDIWFVRSDRNFSGWRLFRARCAAGRLERPRPAPIAGEGIEADPWFSSDGRNLWFISSGGGGRNSAALDIWHRARARDGTWSTPERLPAPVNSTEAEWFPRPASDGWLYFGSRRAGGFGADDIWRARRLRDGGWTVENAGPGLNSSDAEYEFQPSPDGKWGILSTSTGLFMIKRLGKLWRRAYRFGRAVNANGSEIGPMLAEDGRSLVFSRDLGGDLSGELMVAYLHPEAGRPVARRGDGRFRNVTGSRCDVRP